MADRYDIVRMIKIERECTARIKVSATAVSRLDTTGMTTDSGCAARRSDHIRRCESVYFRLPTKARHHLVAKEQLPIRKGG